MTATVTEADRKVGETASLEHFDASKKEGSLFNENNNNLGLTKEEYAAAEKSLVRKLDMTLVPMVWLLYLFNYLDRNNIAYVSKDLMSRSKALNFYLGKRGSAVSRKISVSPRTSSMWQFQSSMLVTCLCNSLGETMNPKHPIRHPSD